MKIYISGPITGHEDYMERFEEAEQHLKDQFPDAIIVNPARINSSMPPDTTWDQYMDASMELLSECDAIYMLDGWEESRGANREYGYALAREYVDVDINWRI